MAGLQREIFATKILSRNFSLENKSWFTVCRAAGIATKKDKYGGQRLLQVVFSFNRCICMTIVTLAKINIHCISFSSFRYLLNFE